MKLAARGLHAAPLTALAARSDLSFKRFTDGFLLMNVKISLEKKIVFNFIKICGPQSIFLFKNKSAACIDKFEFDSVPAISNINYTK